MVRSIYSCFHMYAETRQKIHVFGYVYFVLWPSRFHAHGHLTVLYTCSNIPRSPRSDSLDASGNQLTLEVVWLFILHSGVLCGQKEEAKSSYSP